MINRAKIKDVPEIVKLVNFYAAKGEMLGRSQADVYNSLRDYIVIKNEEKIIGCGALHVVWDDIAEIRSLAIAPDFVGKGLGRNIVEFLIQDARDLELPKVFTLTYKPEFFKN